MYNSGVSLFLLGVVIMESNIEYTIVLKKSEDLELLSWINSLSLVSFEVEVIEENDSFGIIVLELMPDGSKRVLSSLELFLAIEIFREYRPNVMDDVYLGLYCCLGLLFKYGKDSREIIDIILKCLTTLNLSLHEKLVIKYTYDIKDFIVEIPSCKLAFDNKDVSFEERMKMRLEGALVLVGMAGVLRDISYDILRRGSFFDDDKEFSSLDELRDFINQEMELVGSDIKRVAELIVNYYSKSSIKRIKNYFSHSQIYLAIAYYYLLECSFDKDNSFSDFSVLIEKIFEVLPEGSRFFTRGINDFDADEYLGCKTDVGINREDNEDFTAVVTSRLDPNIKLLIVCDGVGGCYGGEVASKKIVEEMIKWFDSKTFDEEIMGDISFEIESLIRYWNKYFRDNFYYGATTMTCAIIGKRETLVVSIGDTRAYLIKDNNLIQLSKDDSYVWDLYENGQYAKDDLRFHFENNIVTNVIGYQMDLKINKYVIVNESYDGILLTSDGVTDIVSDDKIIRIYMMMREQDLLVGKYLDRLVDEAIYSKSEDPDYEKYEYDDSLLPTNPGKDNATTAIFLKIKKR